MRALQNGYILVMIVLMVTLYATTTALNDGEAKSIEPVPTDYLDEPIDPCTHYERYEFDVPGIDAHEVLIKDKECEVLIS
tara:strand:+ start:874 stop:1113 length:240 start_codon:yes stop_codon:yes gene_type:complete